MEQSLAEMIRARVKALGISQRAYADRIGLAPSHMNGLARGKIALPRADLRRRLADDLGISHLQLLVMAGELFAEEIPVAGAPRPLFPKGSPHAKAVELLHELDHASALEVARFCLFQIEHPVVDVPVMVAEMALATIGGSGVRPTPRTEIAPPE